MRNLCTVAWVVEKPLKPPIFKALASDRLIKEAVGYFLTKTLQATFYKACSG